MAISTSTHDAFHARERSLEESYFRTRESELVEKLKAIFHAKLDREELRKSAGITDEAVLDRLMQANIRGELLTVFRLYPLVEMAWANGHCDAAEAKTVTDAAAKLGLPTDSESMRRLEEWLARGPTKDGRSAWRMFAGELRKSLTPKELDTFRHDLMKYARDVAEASGGFLGTFFQISAKEHRVIEEIKKALTHG